MQVGSLVRVKAPFDQTYPDVYVIESVNAETGAFQICGGVDFDPIHLELVEG